HRRDSPIDCLVVPPPTPISPLFPYTTLFRSTSFGVIRRIDEAVRGRPSAIFILIGINDLGRNIPDSIIVRNHERIVRYIQTHSRSEEHTSELQSRENIVCRLLLEKKQVLETV